MKEEWQEIKEIYTLIEADIENVFNGNNSAGVRVRDKLQQMKLAAHKLRQFIQDDKNQRAEAKKRK